MNVLKFDISDYLDSNEMVAEYLNIVLEEGTEADLIVAIGHVAKAIGLSKIIKETGISRSSLNKVLSHETQPQFQLIMKILKAIGGKINISPI